MSSIDQLPYQRYVAGFLAFTCIFLFLDMTSDFREGASLIHLLGEGFTLIVSAVLGLYLIKDLFLRFNQSNARYIDQIEALSAAKLLWENQAKLQINSFRDAISAQFDKWGCSDAEKSIGVMILKGLSHKEIAVARGTSEKTVRQQAGALYAKAGIDGKSQLAAFFLDGL